MYVIDIKFKDGIDVDKWKKLLNVGMKKEVFNLKDDEDFKMSSTRYSCDRTLELSSEHDLKVDLNLDNSGERLILSCGNIDLNKDEQYKVFQDYILSIVQEEEIKTVNFASVSANDFENTFYKEFFNYNKF